MYNPFKIPMNRHRLDPSTMKLAGYTIMSNWNENVEAKTDHSAKVNEQDRTNELPQVANC